MAEGYKRSADDCLPTGLDEYFCEYVDGTMDPDVRAVFEEYLSDNPEVAQQVECMRHARMMLRCSSDCRCAPNGFQHRLRARVERENIYRRLPFGLAEAARFGGMTLAGMVLAVCAVTAISLVATESNRTVGGGLAGVDSATERGEAIAAKPGGLSWANVKVRRPEQMRRAARRAPVPRYARQPMHGLPADYAGPEFEPAVAFVGDGPQLVLAVAP